LTTATNSPKPAIVVAGHTMALAVVRALGEVGVPVVVAHYDERDIAQASKYVVAELRTPDPVLEEDLFIDALMRRGARLHGGMLIPASDDSTVAISRHKQQLEQHYVVACPEWEITERFIDKRKTYALAEAHGVPAPRTLVPGSAADLEGHAAQLGFPMLVKPAESHLFYERFKRKMFRVSTLSELGTIYGMASDAGLAVMLQEIIPGDDSSVVNYNSYFWNGEALAEFTARHLRKAPPEFGSPRVAISERIPEVIEPGRKILAAMGFHGFACTEFKLDRRDGVYKLIEVNGRHNLSGLLAVRCGVNFPLMHYRHLMEGETPKVRAYRSGFYWTDIFRDVGYSVGYLREDQHGLTSYLAPYARPHCDAILDRRDMGPFWARLRYLVRHAGRTWRHSRKGGSSAP